MNTKTSTITVAEAANSIFGGPVNVANSKMATSPAKPPATDPLEIFRQLTPNMIVAYGEKATLTRLATLCWGEAFIDDMVHEMITETTYDGEPKRAEIFVKRVYKKIEKAKNEAEAIELMKIFAAAIKEVDSMYNEIAKEIEGYTDAAQLKRHTVRIADSLQSSIGRIASKAMTKNLITYAEYIKVADSAADHTNKCTIVLFDAIDRKFQLQPSPEAVNDLVKKFFTVIIPKTDDIANFSGQYEALKKEKKK